MNDLITVLSSMIAGGTPIVYAICGDMVGQKSGITSLSVEGSMLCGACAGFAVAAYTKSLPLAVLAAAFSGMFIALLQAYLSIDCKANMFASAFVLNFLAQGLTAFFGIPLLSVKLEGFSKISIPLLSDIPIIGPALFNQDLLCYFSLLLPFIIHYVFFKTRLGVVIRSAGENPEVTIAYGYNPRVVRYGSVLFAGAMAGIGGAQMSIFTTMNWSNDMINGRGFVASSLVVLCAWLPLRSYIAAYVFGLAQTLQIFFQIKQVPISPYVTMMFPYLFTLIALAIVSTSKKPSMPETLQVVIDDMSEQILSNKKGRKENEKN